jgi:hypothetical protein
MYVIFPYSLYSGKLDKATFLAPKQTKFHTQLYETLFPFEFIITY